MRLLFVNILLAALLMWLAGPGPSGAAPVPKGKPKNEPIPLAAKLLGKWASVTFSNGQPVPSQSATTLEFTQEGVVVIRGNHPKRGFKEERGQYVVMGNAIHMAVEDRPNPSHRYWHVLIVSITDDELITLGPGSRPHEVEKSARVRTVDLK